MEGFGVFQVRDKEECKESVLNAIRAGYRLIDTAASYTNEDAVGEAVREAIAEGICTRKELFITSKMWVQDMQNYEMAKKAIDHSIETLGVEYLDLYLLHQAMKDYFSAWRAMEDAYKEGKLRAIGVSNFLKHHIETLMEHAKILPMLNQIEMNAYYMDWETINFCQDLGIVMEAWKPLMRAGNMLEDKRLAEIAAKYHKTPAQVALRFLIQNDVVVLPKSVRPGRIRENIDIFDFEIDSEDMAEMVAMNTGKRQGDDPDTFILP